MNTFAIDSLLKQRQILIARKISMMEEINQEIADIESGIEIISGKKVWEIEPALKYDDQNPDYIKASVEEI